MLATGPFTNYRSCDWFIPREKLREWNVTLTLTNDYWPFSTASHFGFIEHFNDHPNVHLSAVLEFRGSLFSKIKQNDVCALNLKAQPATIILFNETLSLPQSYHLIADFAFSSKILMLTEQKLLLNQNSRNYFYWIKHFHFLWRVSFTGSSKKRYRDKIYVMCGVHSFDVENLMLTRKGKSFNLYGMWVFISLMMLLFRALF